MKEPSTPGMPAPSPAPAPARAPSASSGDAVLVFLDENANPKDRLPLRLGKTIIGRTEGEVLLRHDPHVSPWHAQLTVRRADVVIKDMYSLNGIYQRISRQAVLEDGDRILVGRQVLRFRQGWDEGKPDTQGTEPMGSTPPATAARVLVTTSSGEIADQRLIRETLTIGRTGCNLSIPEDDTLTDKHTQILFDGRHYLLVDLNAPGGVFLAVRGEAILSHQDVIRIGSQLLMLERPD